MYQTLLFWTEEYEITSGFDKSEKVQENMLEQLHTVLVHYISLSVLIHFTAAASCHMV